MARREALLAAAEQVAGLGSFEWLPEDDELLWSDNLYRIMGFEPGEIEPTFAWAMSLIHPDDLDRVQASRDDWSAGGTKRSSGYRIIRPDGSVRHLRTTMVVWEEGASPRRLIAAVQDLTEQRERDMIISAHAATIEALESWAGFDEGLQGLLAELSGALGCVCAVVWVPVGSLLQVVATWQRDGDVTADFDSTQRALTPPRGAGLAGRAWEAGVPVLLTGGEEARQSRQGSGPKPGLRAAIAVPAVSAGEVLAVLEFHSQEETVLTEQLRRSLVGIGYEIGAFLSRRRGELGPPPLTPRELEILKLAAEGLSGPAIAAQLSISPATVKTHFEHAYEKLGVPDRSAAVAKLMRLGVIS